MSKKFNSIYAIEKEFRTLAKQENEIREMFNPRKKDGKKHRFIKDIKADFELDIDM
jgi:hypothetical protein